jgi:ribosomal-protein-alanine N-acetyltransferase
MQLTLPEARDFPEWAALRKASADYLQPLEPTWEKDEFSADKFRRRVRTQETERLRDQGYAFFIRSDAGALVGGLTIGPVRRGCAQSALLGTWIGKPFAGRGYALIATHRSLIYAFRNLRLHRIEAVCLTSNEPSIRVLEHLGFTREGVAKAYWCINGRWQDHYLFGIRSDEFRGLM